MVLCPQDPSEEVNLCVSIRVSSSVTKRQRREKKCTPVTPALAATCTTSPSRPRSCGEQCGHGSGKGLVTPSMENGTYCTLFFT